MIYEQVDERDTLCRLPLAEKASLDELPVLMQAYEFGKWQVGRIHQGEAVCVQTRVGGAQGCIGSFYERYPSTTLLDYSQMVIAAGVFFEDLQARGGYLEVFDPERSNGNIHMKKIGIQSVDLDCVRAQLLGLLDAFTISVDDHRVIGIIGDALRNDILNPKVRKMEERKKYAALVMRLQEGCP